MQLDPNQIRVRIENSEVSYYGQVNFTVIVECLDLDTNRYIVIKETQESVSGDYCRHDY